MPRLPTPSKPSPAGSTGSTSAAALEPGSKAPKFDLESDSGDCRKLGDFAGKWLVLYFYPKDSTPGCTREAQDFTSKETLARLKKLGAEVVGVSKDSIKSHCTFRTSSPSSSRCSATLTCRFTGRTAHSARRRCTARRSKASFAPPS